MNILASTSTFPILRYIAQLLGWLMNGIFSVLDKIGLPNIGVAILIFTIIIYLILTPIQYKTQKSSKIMAAVNPEIQKIQQKYKGKRDQYSMQKMQQETQEVYRRYGVSMMGSCLPMLVQLPLLLAVYQVILHIPGYIAKIGGMFDGLAGKILGTSGAQKALTDFVSENAVRVRLSETLTQENVIDFLYVLKPGQWDKLQEMSQFAALKGDIADVAAQSYKVNSFLGINIAEAPWDAIKSGFSAIKSGHPTAGLILALFIGIAIPVLAWFTQWLNYKLMPQQATANSKDNPVAGQLSTMNTVMPIFSAFICLTLSMGIGIYWIVGAIIRCIQQVIINRKIGKVDVEGIRAQIEEDNKARRIEENRKASGSKGGRGSRTYADPHGGRARSIEDTEKYYVQDENISPNSLTAKANMVRRMDNKGGKKNGR